LIGGSIDARLPVACCGGEADSGVRSAVGKLLYYCVILGAALVTANAARSEDGAADALEQANRARLARPADAGLALRYAQVAAARGQLRPAISAIELALRFNNGLNTLRLELASLYLAAGSANLAAVYAREALASPDIPQDVAVRARQLLATAERGAARSIFAGNIMVGGRYDSNATQATSLGTISVFSPQLGFVPVRLGVTAKGSASLALSGQLTHRYDLGLQREAFWETNLSGFQQLYTDVSHSYNLSVLQLDTGPRVAVAEFDSAVVTLRPFVSASYLAYGFESFASLLGGGVATELRLPPRWTFEIAAQGRNGNFYNSRFRPTVGLYSGADVTLSAAASYAITSATRIAANLYYYDASARAQFYERRGPGANVLLASDVTVFGSALGIGMRVGLRQLDYGGPDPFIDPTRRRGDTIFDAGTSLALPITERVGAVLQYDYIRQDSNNAIYRYDSHAVTLGLRLSL
jgi:hypothetical protein